MSVSKRKCKWSKEKFQNSFLENAMKLSRGGGVGKTELRRSVASGVGGKAECGIMTAKRRKYFKNCVECHDEYEWVKKRVEK